MATIQNSLREHRQTKSPTTNLVSRKELMMIDMPEVMNIRQACHYLGVSTETLYKYALGNKIPAFKFGSRWRFKKSVLDSWMEERSAANRGRG